MILKRVITLDDLQIKSILKRAGNGVRKAPVIVAFWFLPKFLRAGLYTIPEFLEYRFDGVARLAMAIPAIITLVFVATSSVIFSGAKFASEYYHTVPVFK